MLKRAPPPQVLTSTPHGRVLRFELAAGQGIPAHQHPHSQVVLAVLAGQIEVTAQALHTLKATETLAHDGNMELSLLAIQASTLLVTLIHT